MDVEISGFIPHETQFSFQISTSLYYVLGKFLKLSFQLSLFNLYPYPVCFIRFLLCIFFQLSEILFTKSLNGIFSKPIELMIE